ncbi:AMIN-like domain-containing (lipo)protein [Phytoactinopolyspora halotolerans]|uniref:AMIN-like domain-containing protein n=1 Tax=Phytoactinopolyspora halotolerans TaxID=1981512 RepID=A0A6L9SII1_9ACTN|nr:hypothetical protein [Phytoactinopolyspora halotolerans]NEE04474.1 hypothetical protein [Phytoactinopolyspora halotolerans]
MSAVAVLAVAACGDADDDAGDTPEPTPDETASPGPTDTASSDSSPTSSPGPTRALQDCVNGEAGYSVAYPDDWHTNPGDVVAACSLFDPEPVTPEEGTEPDAAIVFNRSDVTFEDASSSESFGRVRSRDSATVADREAVAVLHEATGEGLLDEGTLAYVWVIYQADGALIASTHERPDQDFESTTQVLDRMIEHLDFAEPAPTNAEPASPDGDGETDGQDGGDNDANGERTVVARYDSQEQPFAVIAVRSGSELCLVARANGDEGDPACWAPDADRRLSVGRLDVPGGNGAIGGFAAPGLARILAGTEGAGTAGFRPTEVASADVRGWAMPIGQSETEHVIGYTSDGRMVTVLDARGEPTSVLPEVNTAPESAAPTDDVKLLTAVDSGLHAGYDRVAFRFRGDEVPGYEVSYVDGPVEEPGSGRVVDVSGDATILVRMEHASGRERTGDAEQTYTGPDRLPGTGTSAITEIVRVGDFEGVLTWAIGVRGEFPMRVQEFGDDLIVDVRHPE